MEYLKRIMSICLVLILNTLLVGNIVSANNNVIYEDDNLIVKNITVNSDNPKIEIIDKENMNSEYLEQVNVDGNIIMIATGSTGQMIEIKEEGNTIQTKEIEEHTANDLRSRNEGEKVSDRAVAVGRWVYSYTRYGNTAVDYTNKVAFNSVMIGIASLATGGLAKYIAGGIGAFYSIFSAAKSNRLRKLYYKKVVYKGVGGHCTATREVTSFYKDSRRRQFIKTVTATRYWRCQ